MTDYYKGNAPSKQQTYGADTVPGICGSSLALWLRADLGVTLNGATVSAWADQSGNGRHATQGTGAAQPAYTASSIGSKPALTFDGTDDFLACAATNIAADPCTLFAVCRTATQANRFVCDGGTTGSRLVLYAASGIVSSIFGGGQINRLTDMSTAHVYIGTFNGASSRLSVDGVSDVTGNTGAAGTSGGFSIGINQARSAIWSGPISEIGLISGTLTTANEAALRRYLGARYGITVA